MTGRTELHRAFAHVKIEITVRYPETPISGSGS
jgi:hypothetical protein